MDYREQGASPERNLDRPPFCGGGATWADRWSLDFSNPDWLQLGIGAGVPSSRSPIGV